jgi:hypothetical protein
MTRIKPRCPFCGWELVMDMCPWTDGKRIDHCVTDPEIIRKRKHEEHKRKVFRLAGAGSA